MKKTLLIAYVIACLDMAEPFAQKVYVDWEKDRDLTQYRTYMWADGDAVTDALTDQRIRKAIEYRLAEKEILEVESDPDFYISYHGSTQEDYSLNTVHYGYGYPPRWYGYYGGYWGPGIGASSTRVYKWEKGTLVVDLWDAKDEVLVWRGTLSDTVSDNPQKNMKKIENGIRKIFKRFPPKPSS